MKESNSDGVGVTKQLTADLSSLRITSFPKCSRYRTSYSAKTGSRRGIVFRKFLSHRQRQEVVVFAGYVRASSRGALRPGEREEKYLYVQPILVLSRPWCHFNNTCRVSSRSFHSIGRFRKFLSQADTERIVRAFILSKLDYCNGFLCGIPSREIEKLQRLQNTAARLTVCMKKTDHSTPVLKKVHWFPVNQGQNSLCYIGICK